MGMDPSKEKGKRLLFPFKLYAMLEDVADSSYSSVVSWKPNGRSFVILDPGPFMRDVVPKYFKQTKFRSFTRQLNFWGFKNLHRREWMHEHFFRGKVEGLHLIRRVDVEGTPKMKSSTKPKHGGNELGVDEVTLSSSSSSKNNPVATIQSKVKGDRRDTRDENNSKNSRSIFEPQKVWSSSRPLELEIGSNPSPIIQSNKDDDLLMMCNSLALKEDSCVGCRCSFCLPPYNELELFGVGEL